jgi:hypothetical protein
MEYIDDSDRIRASAVRGVVVRVVCDSCKGKGRVRGGQIEYGELVSCPICDGAGTTSASVTLEQFKRLLMGVRDDLWCPPEPQGDE